MAVESISFKSRYSIFKRLKEPFKGSKKGDYKVSRKEPFKDWILGNMCC